MALTALEVENYKCFGRAQRIDLRPITVLLGKNNAGKSALARLPLLLATGFNTDLQEPLDTYVRGVDVGGSFMDLVHGHSPHGKIRFGLQFEFDGDGLLMVESTVQNVTEFRGLLLFPWVYDFPGRGGQSPPRVRVAMAMSASGLW